MAASAPDIIKVQTRRQRSSEQRGLFVSGYSYPARNSWAMCVAVFLIAAAASFAAAVIFSGNRPSNARVVHLVVPASLALVPTIKPTLPDLAVEAQASKTAMDEAAGFDEVHRRHARRSRIDESAAYDPTKTRTSNSPAPRSSERSKPTARVDPTKANSRTNW